jgi:hypothetical protein
MVGAALSRECIAHECAPTEISNMSGYKVSSQCHPGYWGFVDKHKMYLKKRLTSYVTGETFNAQHQMEKFICYWRTGSSGKRANHLF